MSDDSRFLLYTAPEGAVKVEVFYQDETVWLTQKALAELFGVQRPAVTKHLLNIFATGELAEDSVCSTLEHTAAGGKTYANYPILQDNDNVSALEARHKAGGEYKAYRQRQDARFVSDFDREVRRLQGRKPDDRGGDSS